MTSSCHSRTCLPSVDAIGRRRACPATSNAAPSSSGSRRLTSTPALELAVTNSVNGAPEPDDGRARRRLAPRAPTSGGSCSVIGPLEPEPAPEPAPGCVGTPGSCGCGVTGRSGAGGFGCANTGAHTAATMASASFIRAPSCFARALKNAISASTYGSSVSISTTSTLSRRSAASRTRRCFARPARELASPPCRSCRARRPRRSRDPRATAARPRGSACSSGSPTTTGTSSWRCRVICIARSQPSDRKSLTRNTTERRRATLPRKSSPAARLVPRDCGSNARISPITRSTWRRPFFGGTKRSTRSVTM